MYDHKLTLVENRYNHLMAAKAAVVAVETLLAEEGRKAMALLIDRQTERTVRIADPRMFWEVSLKEGLFNYLPNRIVDILYKRLLVEQKKQWIYKHKDKLEKAFSVFGDYKFNILAIATAKQHIGSSSSVINLSAKLERRNASWFKMSM